ncbi:helix-turn-helix transcriptional regulator [Clostridioides difficile]|uniref:helix-turn-helix transcriptional regulator n=1 Tax=Clostridioides difficile TaxID=1496 RepID=UPI0010B4609F|nr:helix-turn-helix transcriptional regulator [Clostridioides difficile]ELX4570487.1 helix-turn-helix transcriptional regulator [Clostridioides difficile]MBY1421680.1 helix-turn-helix transcriptional regulator [Clostridioides difficile]MBY1824121.1 helix-turn-helix transcriptional regulator [Clostridioides difficile]MBZ0719767.1 helix-turn-helix transcriptional regulator [Clostridioides difficile]MBZ0785084.1 helix-turn-helix transcriptional regulator [Clostridioides difficile]
MKKLVNKLADFKTRIHELRKEKNISQAELASLVGARRETISQLENGRYNPSLKLAMLISRVFEIPIEEIFILIDNED